MNFMVDTQKLNISLDRNKKENGKISFSEKLALVYYSVLLTILNIPRNTQFSKMLLFDTIINEYNYHNATRKFIKSVFGNKVKRFCVIKKWFSD